MLTPESVNKYPTFSTNTQPMKLSPV